MTIFDIALDHLRERERLPKSRGVSAADLELAAMIGRLKAREQAQARPNLLQPLYTEPVDLDALEAGFVTVAEDEDLVIFAD